MEPFSICEVTSTVLGLSLKLCTFFRAIKDAPKEIGDYLAVLESIRCVFMDVREYNSTHRQSLFASEDGLQLNFLEPALRDCELEFKLQLSFIESLDANSKASFFQRSRRRTEWVLRKTTIEGLTRKLEKVQGLLALAVATSSG